MALTQRRLLRLRRLKRRTADYMYVGKKEYLDKDTAKRLASLIVEDVISKTYHSQNKEIILLRRYSDLVKDNLSRILSKLSLQKVQSVDGLIYHMIGRGFEGKLMNSILKDKIMGSSELSNLFRDSTVDVINSQPELNIRFSRRTV